jgi:hypothetical protein
VLAALRASPINPKEKKKKKRQKKEKRKPFFWGRGMGCQGFLEKNTTSQTMLSLLKYGRRGGDFFSKMHFNLADHERWL